MPSQDSCKQCDGHDYRTDQVDVAQRIQAYAPQAPGGLVTEKTRHITVRCLMQGDGEHHGQGVNGKGLNQSGDVHGADCLRQGGGDSEPKQGRVAAACAQQHRLAFVHVDHRGRLRGAGPGVDDSGDLLLKALADVVRGIQATVAREQPSVAIGSAYSVTVNAGTGPKGLPVGLQVIGRVDDDARTLAAAQWIGERLGR